MKTKNLPLLICILLIAAVIVLNIFLLPSLPDDIPMQWKSDGSVSWSAPKLIGIAVPPVIMLIVAVAAFIKDRIGIGTCLALGFLAALDTVLFIVVI